MATISLMELALMDMEDSPAASGGAGDATSWGNIMDHQEALNEAHKPRPQQQESPEWQEALPKHSKHHWDDTPARPLGGQPMKPFPLRSQEEQKRACKQIYRVAHDMHVTVTPVQALNATNANATNRPCLSYTALLVPVV